MGKTLEGSHMDDEVDRFRVCIKELGSVTIKQRGHDLATAVALALWNFRDSRQCQTVATIAYEVLKMEDYAPAEDYWEGYADAVRDFLESARRIINGWEGHDTKLDEKYVGKL
jgi:hypothetical protein